MTRLCWAISSLDYSPQFDQLARLIHASGRYELHYLFFDAQPPSMMRRFADLGIRTHFIALRGKTGFPKALYQAWRLFRELKPEIVHTHLFEATLLGLTAAALAGVRIRIHTRHHSNESHLYYPPHALLYDQVANLLSIRIVAVSKVVSEVLCKQDGVPANKVVVVPHGFAMKEMEPSGALLAEVRRDYKLDGCYPVIGVVSRFVHWKGVQYIVPAFRRILDEHPAARLVIANARGDYSAQILRQIQETLPPGSVTIINIERRIFELFKCFDVFVHVPIYREVEAYGQVYVEALRHGVPSIFTLSGIANEFVKDGHNALVVPFQDSEAIYRAICRLLEDRPLAEELARRGKEDVLRLFTIEQMFSRLDALYAQTLHS